MFTLDNYILSLIIFPMNSQSENIKVDFEASQHPNEAASSCFYPEKAHLNSSDKFVKKYQDHLLEYERFYAEKQLNLIKSAEDLKSLLNFKLPLVDVEENIIQVNLIQKLAFITSNLVDEYQKILDLIPILFDNLAVLLSKLNEDSGNSHSPPSKDKPWLKPNCKKHNGGTDDPPKPKGAQPGHERHTRDKIDLKDADKVITYDIPEDNRACTRCGAPLVRAPENDKQYDFFDMPRIVIQRIVSLGLAYTCSVCGKLHESQVPDEVAHSRLVSSYIIVLFTLQNSKYFQPIRQIQNFFEEVCGEHFSIGYINNCLKEVSSILRPVFNELLDSLCTKKVLNIDETSHNNEGDLSYVWVFVADDIVAYKIGTRSRYTLDLVLGEKFKGIIGCDCFSAYLSFAKRYENADLQLCMAHLLRDFAACVENYRAPVIEYGKKCIQLLGEVIRINEKRCNLSDKNDPLYSEYTAELVELKAQFLKAAMDAPDDKKAASIAKRMQKYGDYYFTFIDNDSVDVTNNISERNLRFVVIARKISLFTQSLLGTRLRETIWTILATCKKKQIDPIDFFMSVLEADNKGLPLPSLVNIGGFVDQKYVLEAEQEEINLLKLQKEIRDQKKAKKLNPSKEKSEPKSEPKPFGFNKPAAPSPVATKAADDKPEVKVADLLKQQKEARDRKKAEKFSPSKPSQDPSTAENSEPKSEPKPFGFNKPAAPSPVATKAADDKPELKVADLLKRQKEARDRKKAEKFNPSKPSQDPSTAENNEPESEPKPFGFNKPAAPSPVATKAEKGVKQKHKPTPVQEKKSKQKFAETPSGSVKNKGHKCHISPRGYVEPIVPLQTSLRASETVLEANSGTTTIKPETPLDQPRSRVAKPLPSSPLSHRRLKAPEPSLKGLEPAPPGLTVSTV
jgi:transposase